MRSPARSHLRAVSDGTRPVTTPAPTDIESLVRLAHDAASAYDGQHVAVHMAPDGDELVVGLLPLGDTHPFTLLAGFSAPPEWSLFGLRVNGRARDLGDPASSRPTEVTFLVSRHQGEASLMVLDGETQVTTTQADGVLPDLCRRVLDLPTAPAPPTTAALWLVMWLDRIVEHCLDPDRSIPRPVAWEHLARLHPALDEPGAAQLPAPDPQELVEQARRHCEDWTWARLRAQPEVVPLPDGPVPPDTAAWMDDGFFARWCLQGFPEAATLVTDIGALLPEELRSSLVAVAEGVVHG